MSKIAVWCSAVRAGRGSKTLFAEREHCTGKRLCTSSVQNLGVEVTGGVLSRPVSPKLAHEAVLAKPPYCELSKMRVTGVQNGKN